MNDSSRAADPALARALASRLKVALRAAETAGAILMEHLGQLQSFEEKSPIDLVTVADQQSEAQLLSDLQSAFPTDTFLAEERDGAEGAASIAPRIAEVPFCWAIDPLDGTTNFAHGYLNFAVSIGLMHHGEPVLGVVLAPARREVFVGGFGIRASCNNRAVRVSEVDDLSKALLATGFPYDRRERIEELMGWLGRAISRAHGVRRAGAAAIDLCEVAAGRLDGFYEVGLSPWDLCAGHAIIEAAGGTITGWQGQQHDLFAGRTLASNGQVHAALVELLQP